MKGASAATFALHAHLERRHWTGDALIGPDYGVRLNYRVGRFAKSYLRWLPWRDSLYYLQAQAYWVLANWRLHDLTGEQRFARIAMQCSHGIVACQREDGAWTYPNPAWKGRIANAEGTWAALGLLEGFARTRSSEFLDAARRWYRYLDEEIGWRRAEAGLAANYFAHTDGGGLVPNNSAFVLRLLAELAHATGDPTYLDRCPALLDFLAIAQRPGGELPYVVGPETPSRLEHFQCYQYNAFQALDLIRYAERSGDPRPRPLVTEILRFLSTGVNDDGDTLHACGQRNPQVTYHAAVLAAALHAGARAGLTADASTVGQTYARLLQLQAGDGSFPHSRHDYGMLSDRRSYPRSLAMLLFLLLAIEETD